MRPRTLLKCLLVACVAASSLASATKPKRKKPAGGDWPTVEELFEDHTVDQTAELRVLVWATPLGLLFKDYLFAPGDPTAITARSHRLTYRLFSAGPLVAARMAALELLKEDLYENGLVDNSVHLRLSQLESEVVFKKHAIEDRSTKSFIPHVVVPVAAGAAAGSPRLRHEFVKSLEKSGIWHSKKWAAELIQHERELHNVPIYRNWSWVHGSAAFSAVVSLYWLAYNFVETGTGENEGLERRFWNYLLQLNTSIEYL